MTATLVAMLVEEGKLNWTTTLGELFAGMVKPMHPAWEKVTLRHVLAHRSGLRFAPDGLVRVLYLCLAPGASLRSRPELRSSEETLPQQRLEIARQALSRPPKISRAPNTGIPISATFSRGSVGTAHRSCVEDLMRERLFQPLGISTGGFGPPGAAGKTEQPWGTRQSLANRLTRATRTRNSVVLQPAGLVHMTITIGQNYRALFARRSGQPALPGRAAQAGYFCGIIASGRTRLF